MESFALAFRVVFPLIFMMGLGYFLRTVGKVKQTVFRNANTLLFRSFLPFLLFCNIYDSDLYADGLGTLILYAMVGMLVLTGLLIVIVPCLSKENPRRGVLVQAIMRGNIALYGIPIATAMLGDGNVGTVSIVTGALVPLSNILAVLVLDLFSSEKVKPSFKGILLDIIKNPLIIAVVLGLLVKLINLQLPEIVYDPCKQIARTATPLSFVALGGCFTFTSAVQNRKALAAGTLSRLVLVPLIFLLPAVMMGFRGEAMVALLVVFAVPTAVTSATMAQEMGGDVDLANEMVVFTSVFSILTMFLWIYVLSALALL
ncbi:MAG: AEC family transporter [Eubacteriales bacterium]|nr:AEC family transporter [Eubacteriales bacterium]